MHKLCLRQLLGGSKLFVLPVRCRALFRPSELPALHAMRPRDVCRLALANASVQELRGRQIFQLEHQHKLPVHLPRWLVLEHWSINVYIL